MSGHRRRRAVAVVVVACAVLAVIVVLRARAPRAVRRVAAGTPTSTTTVAATSTTTTATPPAPADPGPPSTVPLPARVMLHVAAQSQLPELANGCEVTSVSMLLGARGHPVDKLDLARDQPVDPSPLVTARRASGGFFHTITRWGDPNVGFVGDVSKFPGYGIFHGPVAVLIDRELPGQAVDLTGAPFETLEARLAAGVPVVMWTTATFRPTDDWVTWQGPRGPVIATQLEHAVVLVGYNDDQLFVNDPLTGKSAVPVDRTAMLAAWRQLGSQAVTVERSPSDG